MYKLTLLDLNDIEIDSTIITDCLDRRHATFKALSRIRNYGLNPYHFKLSLKKIKE